MKKKLNIYPLFIMLLLGAFLCFSTWSAMRAAESHPQVTDADYYSKGLKYSSTLLEKKAASVLGWTVSSHLQERTLQFHLHDKTGQPVSGATADILMYFPHLTTSRHLPLEEITPGVYQLGLTSEMTGEMSARLEFEHHGARLNRQFLLNL